MFPVRRIILRGALFVVNLVLLGYLGFLLFNLYRSYDQIQVAAIEQLQHNMEKRAILLESFLKDRAEDLVDLSEKQQLTSYFENLSLGMSMEYGLGASINDLNSAVEQYRLRKKLDGKPIYRRIAFLDASGSELAESSEPGIPFPEKGALKHYTSVKKSGVRMYLTHSDKGSELVLSLPYFFKEHYSAHLLLWIGLDDIYRHFIESANSVNEARQTRTCLQDGKEYLASPSNPQLCAIPYRLLPSPADLKPGKQSFQITPPSSASPVDITAITLRLSGTPLFLTSFVLQGKKQTTSAIELVLTTGAIGLLILSGIVVLARTDLNMRVVETRLEETRLREKTTEAQNLILTETAAALNESKERLTLALAGADLGLWDWNLPKGTVAYSEQWALMLGFQLNEIGSDISVWESLVHPDDLPQVKVVLQQHLDGKSLFYETEHRCRTKSGEWIWILDRGRVVERDADGKPVRMAGTHLDITDRKIAEDSLRKLNDELEQRVKEELRKNREKDAFMLQQDKMASIGQLAAGVAHEVNNPVGFIISNLGTLKEYLVAIGDYIEKTGLMLTNQKSCSPDQFDELRTRLDIAFIMSDVGPLLDESLEGADRVKQIVRDLKDFARIDETGVKETDLNQCVRSTVNIVRNELKYVASLELDLGEIPMVLCNPQQINQVITNLLVNAAQAIEGHGVIRVVTSSEGSKVALRISDTGSGIPSDLLNRIFEPFFTTKPVGKGTGLGLTISYDIVKKNGGEIVVESELGKGTSFIITLPAVEAVL